MSNDVAEAGFPNNEGAEKVGGGLLNIDPEPETDSDEEGANTTKFTFYKVSIVYILYFITYLDY